MCKAKNLSVAEWLTRRPAKPVTFGRASSNLVRRGLFFPPPAYYLPLVRTTKSWAAGVQIRLLADRC